MGRVINFFMEHKSIFNLVPQRTFYDAYFPRYGLLKSSNCSKKMLRAYAYVRCLKVIEVESSIKVAKIIS